MDLEIAQPTPIDALRAIIEPGQITELRAFVPDGRFTATWSGYYDDPETLLSDAEELDRKGASGVYFIPNAVSPDLLARSKPNTCRQIGRRDSLTKDSEIERRRWLLLDIDPERAAGISSTDDEKERAFETLTRMADLLESEGMPEPIVADSGNGYHLMYPIDLPADDGGLTADLTKALSRIFSTDEAHVDTAVSNAARIWKVYETTARKGYSTEERPHRRAEVLTLPEIGRRASEDDLRRVLAALTPEEPEKDVRPAQGTPVGEDRPGDAFNIDGWPECTRLLQEHGWTHFYTTSEGVEHWRRPGKSEGLSATYGHIDGAFYNFSDNGDPFAPRGTYSPFAVYAHLEHKGDFSAAARALAERGYGKPLTNGREAVPPILGSAEVVEPDTPTPEPEAAAWLPMPLDVLPDAVAGYARAQAAAIGCDAAFVAWPALAVLGSAVGTRYRLHLKRSWHETATLWNGTVAPSGSAKSPAWEAALRPVDRLEREARAVYEQEMQEYLQEQNRRAAMKKEERLQQDELPQPVMLRRKITDATVEAVVDRHAKSPGGLLLARDEGAGWIDGMNRYASAGSGGEMQSWIELHDGRPVTVDRKTGETRTYFIGRPAVAAAFTTQPSVLRQSLKPGHFSSGFAARLGLVMPPVEPRRWTDADVSVDVFDGYDTLVRRLDEMPVPGKDDDVPVVTLSRDAREVFAAWVDENGQAMQRLPDGPLRSAFAKIEARAARYALIFHLADHVMGPGRIAEPQPINGYTMQRAVELARWTRAETARIYDVLGFNEAAKTDDEKLLDRLPDAFTWEHVADTQDVQKSGAFKIIRRLKSAGLVERMTRGQYRRTDEPIEQAGH